MFRSSRDAPSTAPAAFQRQHADLSRAQIISLQHINGHIRAVGLKMSTSTPTTSIYGPLRNGSDEIRLIMIEPSSSIFDEIHCSIEIVELSKAPKYYALSYTWGEANITEDIKLSDCSVRVTTNLAAALRRIRCWKEPTSFWIDAICINQNSVLEKNHQVPLMATIYSQAEKVVMWLGEEGDDSERAIDFIKRWRDGIANTKKKRAAAYVTRRLSTILSFVEDPLHKQSVQAVRCLLNRSYWSRI